MRIQRANKNSDQGDHYESYLVNIRMFSLNSNQNEVQLYRAADIDLAFFVLMFSPFLSYYKCVHGSIVSAEQPFNGGSSDKLQTRPGLIPHTCTRAHIHTNTQIFGHLDTHVTHLMVDNAASSTVHAHKHKHTVFC